MENIIKDFEKLLDAVESLNESVEYLRESIYALKSKKEVPYISQWDKEADVRRGDCGPACLTMILRYFFDDAGTVNEVAEIVGQEISDSSTNLHQLKNGARYFGLEGYVSFGSVKEVPIHQVNELSKVILLIDYGELRDQLKKHPNEIQNQDIRYDFGHFVVLLGETETHYIIHDPDFWGANRELGAFRKVPKAALQAAYDSVAPGNKIKNAYLVLRRT